MSRESIDINSFSGMNNIKQKEGLFISDGGVVEPRIILNADATERGRLESRDGTVLHIPLPGANSIWAGSRCLLCMANNTLYRLAQGIATPLGSVDSRDMPVSYAEAGNKVFLSNRYFQRVFDPSNNSLNNWGIELPPGPMMISTAGNLPVGQYHVCFTSVVDGELSGNGPITAIELTSEGGIQVLNTPATAIVWMTDPNESIFFKVGIGVSSIVGLPSNVEPLPSFLCAPPPYLENITHAFGRIWGSNGPVVYYSEPYHPEWFRIQTNRFKYESDVKIIASVPTGLFIGTALKTWFLGGKEPEQMEESDAGSGSVRGTLVYCNNLPELGDILGTPEKGYVGVPVWRTTEGVVSGNASGRLFNLSKNRLRMGTPEVGASLYREKNGVFQFLTSSRAGTGMDPATKSIFSDGKVFFPSWSDTDNDSATFTETVECEVRRNGEVI